jgi:hypothetical protein
MEEEKDGRLEMNDFFEGGYDWDRFSSCVMSCFFGWSFQADGKRRMPSPHFPTCTRDSGGRSDVTDLAAVSCMYNDDFHV